MNSHLIAFLLILSVTLHNTEAVSNIEWSPGSLSASEVSTRHLRRKVRQVLSPTTTESDSITPIPTSTPTSTELLSTTGVPLSPDTSSASGSGESHETESHTRDKNNGSSDLAGCKDTNETLYLLSLLPYPDPILPPSWDEGPTLFLAAQVAVELINKRCDILPGYNLQLLQGDSGCDIASKAYLTFMSELLYSRNNVVGMVGPGCSTSAIRVAPLSGHNQTALLNVHIAGSLLLSDREKYPYSFGTLDSTEIFVDGLLALMELNDWTMVGALYDETRLYYYSTLQLFQKRVQHTNVSLFSSAVYDTFIPLDVIQDAHIRIIVLFVGPDFLSRILCLAYHLNMTYPAYQFVIISRVSEEIVPVKFHYDGTLYSCNTSLMEIVKNGALILHYQLRAEQPSWPGVGISLKEFDTLYQQRIDDYNDKNMDRLSPSFWATSYFDAVWSLAMALNSSMNTVDLSSYRYGDQESTNTIRKMLLKHDFVGLSGHLKFKEATGYVTRKVDVYQLDDHGSMTVAAVYNTQNNSIILTSNNASFVNDSFKTETVSVYTHVVSRPVGGMFAAVGILGLVIVIFLHILTLVYRKRVSVKASSPNLAQATFVGCYFLITGLMAYFCLETFSGHFSPQAECGLWYILNYTLLIGATMIFGSMCARTFRLYRIYVHFRNPGKLISNKVLIGFMITLTSVMVILCIAWVISSPFHPRLEYEEELNTVVNSEGKTQGFVLTNRTSVHCSATYYLHWFLGSSSLIWILMLVALWLALRTRNIPHKHFQTHSVYLLVYLLSGVIALGLPTYFLSLKQTVDVTTQFVVLNMVVNLMVYFVCIFLFLPPLLPVLRVAVVADTCIFQSSIKSTGTTSQPQSPL